MSKLLAILKELATTLDIPKEMRDKIEAYKSDDDIDQEEISKSLRDGHRSKLDILSRNAQVQLNKEKDEAYKAAERKIKTSVEALIKDKFELSDSEADNVEALVDEAMAKSSSKSAKGGNLTDDAVKTHPLYVQLEKKAKKELKEEQDRSATALKTAQDEYALKEIYSEVVPKGLDLFKGMNPILSSDETKAANQLKIVEDKLRGYKYQKVDGDIIVLNPDGTPLENELKEKVKYEDLVKSVVSPIFDFKAAEPRQAPNGANGANPPNNGGNNSGTKYAGTLPKTKGELASMLVDSNTSLEQRQELSKWSDANASALAD